jgi:two-component system NtrC family sensor kinase
VTSAPNGAEAWRLFVAGGFPLVISDWMMPEVDGLELIRRIRAASTPGYVFTILVTARSETQDVVQGMEAGADDFLTKPYERDELRVRLRAGERIIRLEQHLEEQNRALRETQAALVQSEKLATIAQLAAGMAHEINNPISFVTNNLAVLRRDVLDLVAVLDKYREGRSALACALPALADEIDRLEGDLDLLYLRDNLPRLLEKSLDGLSRIRDVTRNLRDFARLDEAEFKELDVNEAVQSALEVLHHDFRARDVRVETTIQPLPPLLGHPGRLNQVFFHILQNALLACRAGGRVQLRTQTDADGIIVEVEDDGAGIRPEDLPRIFEPFFTTRPVGQGRGLGLYVAYGVVREHGGVIDVTSERGSGTLVRVRLPFGTPTRSDPLPAA